MRQQDFENLAVYSEEEIELYTYWKWNEHFILINPRRYKDVVKEFPVYALDTRDGTDFRLEKDSSRTEEILADRQVFLLAIEK